MDAAWYRVDWRSKLTQTNALQNNGYYVGLV